MNGLQPTIAGGVRPRAGHTPTRRAIWLSCVYGLAGALSSAPLRAAAAAETLVNSLPAPRADHHLHIQGPGICAALARLQSRNPAVFQGVDPAVLNPRAGADALKVLDAAGVERGVLLSEAYMFGSPLMAPDNPDVASLTRAENAYNVSEAHKSGGRLVAFVGVDPLSPTALPEIDYWAGRGAVGLKLHLANSLVDFGDGSHMAQVREAFAAANRRRLPIVVHLRNRSQWGAAQANAFIDQVLPAADGLAVQVAHGAGWGALDQPTVAALDAFSVAIAAHKPGTKLIAFDLALVSAPWTKPDDAVSFADAMRRVGLERFLFASDWPAKYTPGEEAAFLARFLPLSESEWRTILPRQASYLPGRKAT